MRVGPDEHADYSRITLAESERFFQHGNRFVRLTVCNERETKKPARPVGRGIIVVHCQIASQFANGFIVVARLEYTPSHAIARNSDGVKLPGPAGPCERLFRAPLRRQPARK